MFLYGSEPKLSRRLPMCDYDVAVAQCFCCRQHLLWYFEQVRKNIFIKKKKIIFEPKRLVFISVNPFIVKTSILLTSVYLTIIIDSLQLCYYLLIRTCMSLVRAYCQNENPKTKCGTPTNQMDRY